MTPLRVALGTYEFSDDDRRAIANYFGQPGLASRKVMRDWVLGTIQSTMEMIAADPRGEDVGDA